MYQKRHVGHVGFGEGDDGWEIFKIDEEDGEEDRHEDVIAQVQTETVADALIRVLDGDPVLGGLKRAIAALNTTRNFVTNENIKSYELIPQLEKLVKEHS